MPDGNAAALRIYAVELSTLLGKRMGNLTLNFFGDRFDGVLSLMKAENPVYGHMLDANRCQLTGSIRTRMNSYPFEAEGTLMPEKLDLTLHCAAFNLPLHGNRKEE